MLSSQWPWIVPNQAHAAMPWHAFGGPFLPWRFSSDVGPRVFAGRFISQLVITSQLLWAYFCDLCFKKLSLVFLWPWLKIVDKLVWMKFFIFLIGWTWWGFYLETSALMTFGYMLCPLVCFIFWWSRRTCILDVCISPLVENSCDSFFSSFLGRLSLLIIYCVFVE